MSRDVSDARLESLDKMPKDTEAVNAAFSPEDPYTVVE